MSPGNSPLTWLLVFSLLTGCAAHDHARRGDDREFPGRRALGPGYLAQQKFATTSVQERWALGTDSVEVDLLVPQGSGGKAPLVIYLPGLGEKADAGLAWRRTWAEAGYAVASLQLEKLAKDLPPAKAGRSDESRVIARQQYASTALSHRLVLMDEALRELKRRSSDLRETALAVLDFSRIAVAGFDLGAQTAMAVAGESFDSASSFKGLPGVKCVIAFSPYADFSVPGFEQRFGSIHLPVLSVTSADDGDPYGVISTPEIRRAPFQYMPTDRKYLLALFNVPHSLIGGSETPAADSSHASLASPNLDNNGDDNGNAGGRHRGRGRRNDGGGSSRIASRGATPVSPAAWSEQIGIIRSVSTAYLDAMVREDPEASRWLVQDAHRWLGDAAELIAK